MRSIFLVIRRQIGQKCPKKLKNALKPSKNAPKKLLWLDREVLETYL